ncbi:hypothetical protein AN189_17450 [Loktanella sp. 3ANDIMAR09]|uniref:hypothetical protein n=1 Tax=Loktanella sp. 3ANDIMAR09 TaxID=1225657 RepID=UPI0006F86509|nr:hypothetical protein [Loktanella sp. 3ANDIMAR09]KQI67011.1 hypothetical protein AN189_17450 [Loktanella sp. 3ANDIMAR09]
MPTATEAQIKRAIRAARQEGCATVVVEGAIIKILVTDDTPPVTSHDETGADEWDNAIGAAR